MAGSFSRWLRYKNPQYQIVHGVNPVFILAKEGISVGVARQNIGKLMCLARCKKQPWPKKGQRDIWKLTKLNNKCSGTGSKEVFRIVI